MSSWVCLANRAGFKTGCGDKVNKRWSCNFESEVPNQDYQYYNAITDLLREIQVFFFTFDFDFEEETLRKEK
jgi:hypothetical protein